MSHPFGNLIKKHLSRKHGLSQSKLAQDIDCDAALVSKMCKGERLSSPSTRGLIIKMINWFILQGVFESINDANGLLDAAGLSPLDENNAVEAKLIKSFRNIVSSTKFQDVEKLDPTILLVDNSDTWGTYMVETLRDEGFNVIWGESKREAESLLEKNKDIKAVITELNLKSNSLGLDGQGYLLLEQLEKLHPQLPKIVLSALENDGKLVRDLYERYNVNYVAIKPDTASDLEFIPKFSRKLRVFFASENEPTLTPKTSPVGQL